MKIIGIDPGLGGGIALLVDDMFASVWPMPTVTYKKRFRKRNKKTGLMENKVKVTRFVDPFALGEIIDEANPTKVFIERVHSMPKQGVASTFSFGTAFGCAIGCVGALQIPIEFVTPQDWKKHFHLGSDKDASIKLAARLSPDVFSDIGKHDGMAEAILIAHYGGQL